MNTYSYKRLQDEAGISLAKQLLTVFSTAFEDAKSYQSAVPDDSYIRTLLNDNSVVVMVAQDESEHVVGGLVAYELKKLEQQRSELYLYDIAVHKEHRRRGVATKLIEHLQSVGRDMGAYVIFVQADNIDTAAVNLYTKLSISIETDVTHFDIKITNL